MSDEITQAPAVIAAPLKLSDILDGCKVHSAEAPDGNTLSLVIRKGRKQHKVTLKFSGLNVTRKELKRVSTTTYVDKDIGF